MTSPLHVDISRQAAGQIEAAASWWAENRPAAPGAIGQELERAFALVAFQPSLGARALNVRLRGVRRLHLSRIHYHVSCRAKSIGSSRGCVSTSL